MYPNDTASRTYLGIKHDLHALHWTKLLEDLQNLFLRRVDAQPKNAQAAAFRRVLYGD